MKALNLHAAYLLHSRPYRETSLLADFFTRETGRVSLVVRGAKRKHSKLTSLLQPFVPLTIAWQGKGPLYTLTTAENRGKISNLVGKRLLSGLYINELIFRLCKSSDAHVALFDHYEQVLQGLQSSTLDEQIILRKFEKNLLREIGYELPLLKNTVTGKLVEESESYYFEPEQGPILVKDREKTTQIMEGKSWIYQGATLIALEADRLSTRQQLLEAKSLMRQIFAIYLGDKPLATRKLFAAY